MREKKDIYYELLVLRCKRGRKDALEELVRLWEKRLFYYILRLIEDEQQAWQILQETWIKVLQNIGNLREGRKLPIWLYSIARNTAINHLRGKYSDQKQLREQFNTGDIEVQDNNLTYENAEHVHYALDQISLNHREILTLFFLQDLTVDEIAEVLKIPVGTVKSRMYYAKKALKTVLETEAGTHE